MAIDDIDAAVSAMQNSKDKVAHAVCALPLGRALVDAAKAHSATLRAKAVAMATVTSNLQELATVLASADIDWTRLELAWKVCQTRVAASNAPDGNEVEV